MQPATNHIHLLDPKANYDAFLTLAASLLLEATPPDAIQWQDSESGVGSLFDPTRTPEELADLPRLDEHTAKIAQRLGRKGKLTAHHADPERWDLLYRIAYRLSHGGQRNLLSDILDPDTRKLETLAHHVSRDMHKMKAFVRFQRVRDAQHENQPEQYVAWHRPDHRIMRLIAPFFVGRFGSMRWTIFTPHESATWDGQSLTFAQGVPADQVNEHDQVEELWKTYYAHIFNPARIKINAMVKEMPKRYWSTLPEAQIIEDLLKDAPARVRRMIEAQSTSAGATPFLPPRDVPLTVLAEEAQACAGCPLSEMATHTVFGEGPPDARIMLIGEQPGDEEDRAARPFVGPAGQLLNKALAAANMSREDLYITNAVKHFKYIPKGNTRLHRRANPSEIRACKPWLDREIESIDPDTIILLGATAGQSIFGAGYRVHQSRGKRLTHPNIRAAIYPTIHPAKILRAPKHEQPRMLEQFIEDLRTSTT